MTYPFRSLGDFLDALEAAGLLVRVHATINKDTELHPFVRLQYRGLPDSQRRGFLFEAVTDSAGRQYHTPVAVACMAGSRAIYALGMGVNTALEIHDRWVQAQANPIPPVRVEDGPVHAFVYRSDELAAAGGVSMIPVPISTPGFDNAPYTSASHWLCRDPDTGKYNLGNYRGQLKSPLRIGCFCGLESDMLQIWRKYRKRGEAMPVALVAGVPPHISYAAVARLPRDVDEYDVAGGLAGAPVELVRCVTNDLEVPAEAEFVIEGMMPTDALEPEGPFGEYPGYMAKTEVAPYMEVTAITHRPNPIYQSFISQFPPGENSVISGISKEGIIRKLLAVDLEMPNVVDVATHEATGSGYGLTVIQLRDPAPGQVEKIIEALPSKVRPKTLVIVDDDVDPADADAVNWAIAFRAQPNRDVQIRAMPESLLDPSVAPPAADDARDPMRSGPPRSSSMSIDATRKWAYPPTSLPTRPFMERALDLWQAAGLPDLSLKEPWYGYELGYWPDERRQEAELAVLGRYYETGTKFASQRRVLPHDET